MYILPGLYGLLLFIYVRPFEFVPALKSIPFLYIFFAMSIIGLVLDLGQAKGGPAAPHRPLKNIALAFSVWCLISGALGAPAKMVEFILTIVILLVIFFLVSDGVQTFATYEAVATLILGCSLWVAFVCAHQGLSPTGCIMMAPEEDAISALGIPDGRSCERIEDCWEGIERYSADGGPEIEWECEHIGLFGTTSIQQRVRYVGVLLDPNEASLAVCVGLPFAFAMIQRKRSLMRTLILIVSLTLVAMTTVMSKSRGGQLTFLAVIGTYFIQKYGWKGMVVGGLMGAPMMMLGGRKSADAEESSMERLGCWAAGMKMWMSAPIKGVGFRQFAEYHFLTAHNSFVLAPAEIGYPGMLLWTLVLYTAAKIPFMALRTVPKTPENEPIHVWGLALFASLIGAYVGIFFLSFCYHYVLWIYLGLAAAFYNSARKLVPTFRVELTKKDAMWVGVIDLGVIIAITLYTRMKGAW